ncbi:MAG: MBL fold metallo-hydrolase [Actinobacteria bacterium]|nr:MBL fold metallo-hydrolase [Actinomycetota bacterium]
MVMPDLLTSESPVRTGWRIQRGCSYDWKNMIQVTGTLQKTAWANGIMPPVEDLGSGLWSIPVPLPDNPLRYVLVYALEIDGGLAIVDAGWNTEEAWQTLTAGLESFRASVRDVRAVLVTHIHPDHYGLAGRVKEASGAWIALHPADAALIPNRYADPTELLDTMQTMLKAAGVPAGSLEEFTMASMAIRQFVSTVEPDVLLEDGDMVKLPGVDLKALWTPGHSPGHLCFYSEKRRILFAGDHVLPRITPIVTVHTQQALDPLGDYMSSLARIRNLAVDEVMPAHEYRFTPLATRVDELLEHHESRLKEVQETISIMPGSTVWEVTNHLHWAHPLDDLPLYMRRAAVGEAMAHIVVLETRKEIARRGGQPLRFYATHPAK